MCSTCVVMVHTPIASPTYQLHPLTTVPTSVTDPLHQLLQNFANVFSTPHGFHSSHSFDHRINLFKFNHIDILTFKRRKWKKVNQRDAY